jgi:HK97 family phage major capsid protein
MTDKTPEQLATEVKAALDDTRRIAEDALKQVKATGDVSAETKAAADKSLAELNTLKAAQDALAANLRELEQKYAVPPAPAPRQSIGQQVSSSEAFKAAAAGPQRLQRAAVELKAVITTSTADAAGAAGDLVPNNRLAGVSRLPERRLTVRDLVMPGRMDGQTLEYAKETGFTNSAAGVAEGAAKPQSDLKFDLVTTTAKVVAHHMKASRQVLSDAPQLQSMIDGKLLYGLALKEEQMLLAGDGTGQNLLGIIPQATAYSAAFTPSAATVIDTIRLALLQAALAEYPASGIVLHPSDWARIELTKDSTGQYIIGNPQGTLAPTLWSVPVVATQSITIDKFLVGAFNSQAQIFDRWSASISVATENEDDFLKNLITILAEQRLAFAVYRPEAFVYGDLGFVV